MRRCTPWLTEADRSRYMLALQATEVDPELIPVLRWLNAIDGVCTMTSCLGWHRHCIGMGFLEVHLSEEKAQVLEKAFSKPGEFCDGLFSSFVRSWSFLHESDPIITYTMSFSGQVAMRCLMALVHLLEGGRACGERSSSTGSPSESCQD